MVKYKMFVEQVFFNFKIFCFYIIFSTIISSCNRDSNNHLSNNKDCIIPVNFEDIPLSKYYYLSEFTDKIEYLKLETNDSCFLKKISKVVTVDNEIFISDGERLFVFNRNTGGFIRSIGKIGRGPGEYFEVEDFVIFPEQNILFITDLRSGILSKFNLEGKFLKNFKLSHTPFKLNKIGNKLVGLYSYPDFIFNKMHSLLFTTTNIESKEILIDRSYTGLNESMYGKIPSTSRSQLEYFNDTLTYWEFENDTIYKIIDTNKYKAAYSLNYSLRESKEAFSKFSNLIETKNYIFFLQGINMSEQEMVHCIYEKSSQNLNSVKFPFDIKKMQLRGGIKNDLDNGWPFLPIGQTNQNELFCYFFKHELDLFLEKRKDVLHNIPEYVTNSNYIDNPVIMLIKLRQ